MKPTHGWLKGKVVCVTGAGGSIGSQLCERIVQAQPAELVLISLTENGLFEILKKLKRIEHKVPLRPILGSVTDATLLAETLPGVDVVIHAAAHKHVPLCEAQPLAAIANNIGGTYQLAQEAWDCGVETFVLVSSDKAVFPMSVMGATKRVAEMIVRDLFNTSSLRERQFVTVRFGNVLDSAGSVLPLWREQIKAGGPLTLTDPECERYFMSIPDAVELILAAPTLVHSSAGQPFIFDMGRPRKMGEMAAELMKTMKRKVTIKTTGLRPGEKLVESLHHGGELFPTAHPLILRVAEDGTKTLDARTLLGLLGATRDRKLDKALKVLWSIVA